MHAECSTSQLTRQVEGIGSWLAVGYQRMHMPMRANTFFIYSKLVWRQSRLTFAISSKCAWPFQELFFNINYFGKKMQGRISYISLENVNICGIHILYNLSSACIDICLLHGQWFEVRDTCSFLLAELEVLTCLSFHLTI
jgi:hypothetical protein